MDNQRLIAGSEHVERQNKKLIQKLNSSLQMNMNANVNIKDNKDSRQKKKTIIDSDLNIAPTNLVNNLSQPSVLSQANESLGSKYSRQAR